MVSSMTNQVRFRQECNFKLESGSSNVLYSYSLWHTVFGEDFTLEAGDVFQATFIAMSTSDGDIACDEGTIIDDDVLEGEHSFEIEIASTNPQLTNISPASAMVTIQDNEGTVVAPCS